MGPREQLHEAAVVLGFGAVVLKYGWPGGGAVDFVGSDVGGWWQGWVWSLLFFVSALLFWRHVLANRRIMGVIGGGLV